MPDLEHLINLQGKDSPFYGAFGLMSVDPTNMSYVDACKQLDYKLQRKPAQLNNGVLEIYINGLIGQHLFLDEDQQYTAANLREDLAVDPQAPVSLFIDSPGGFLYAGINMYSQIQRRAVNTPIEAYIDGAMASAATLPAIATESITASNYAVGVLVHRSWGPANGNAIKLQERVDQMLKTDEALAQLYANFTGKSVEEMLTLMTQDRILTAGEALENNLIHRIRGVQDDPQVSNTANITETEFAWMQAKAHFVGDS